MDIENKPKVEGSSCSEQAKPHTCAKSPAVEGCCERGTQEQEAYGVTIPPSEVLSPPLPSPPPVTVASSPDQTAGVNEQHSVTRFAWEDARPGS